MMRTPKEIYDYLHYVESLALSTGNHVQIQVNAEELGYLAGMIEQADPSVVSPVVAYAAGIWPGQIPPGALSGSGKSAETSTEEDPPADPLTQPLPPAPPPTWEGREGRVHWCLENLTEGEKAHLYRLLNESDRLRLDACRTIERKERKTL